MVPIKKEIIKKDKIIKISYKIKFIDSYRLSQHRYQNLSIIYQKVFIMISVNIVNLDYVSIKDNQGSCTQLIFRCFSCKKNNEKDFNKELIQRFANIYEFCNGDLNRFILLLRKGAYSYEYMDNWERFNEILVPNKEPFHSNLNMEDITDTDYRHANKVFKELELKNLGEYHDLYVQSDTLLLADVFENFRNMCIKVYELDPAHFLTAPGLAWQACLKKQR